jgi:hypothetical protein
MLLTIFQNIPDQRRPQGRMYQLHYLLFFSVLAILSGADSYRNIHTFIKTHFTTLQNHFDLLWKKAPAYSTIRYAIQGVDPKEMEKAFRTYAKKIAGLDGKKYQVISLDGKTMKGSFDHFQDQKAIQVFSALLGKQKIILGHEEIKNQKTNEIPVARKLIKGLKLEGCLFTMDAMHCQKKLLKQRKKQVTK